MKILKRGTPVHPWKKERNCAPQGGGSCGSKLLILESDLHWDNASFSYRLWFRCPVCGQWSSVSVPSVIMRRVKKNTKREVRIP